MNEKRTALALAVALGCAAPRAAWGMTCPDDASSTCRCVHPTAVVPGLSGPPEWFDVDGDGFWRPELDDPRWSGGPLEHLAFSDQLVVTDAAQARVVQTGNFVYVLLQAVKDDEGPEATGVNVNDYAYLGITSGSASQAYAVRIPVIGDGSVGTFPAGTPHDTPLPQPVATGPSYWASDASGSFAASTTQSSLPAWMDQVAIWKPSASVIAPGDNRTWAVTFRVDTSASGLNVSAGSIRMFLGLGIHMQSGFFPFANSNPASGSAAVVNTIVPADTSSWARYAEIGSACTGASVSSGDIGVYPGVPGTTPNGAPTDGICVRDPCPTPGGDPNNVFRVVIRNVDNTGGIGPWQLRARLRIADCGSAVSKPESVPWTDLASTPTGTDILTGADTALTSGNGWYWEQLPDSAGSPTSNVIIDYQCNRAANANCPLLKTTVAHRCLFVEVGGTDSFEFSRASAYRELITQSVVADAGDASIADSGSISRVDGSVRALDGSVHPSDGGGGDSGAAGSGLDGSRRSAGGAGGASLDGGELSNSTDAGATPSGGHAPSSGCGCETVHSRSTANLLLPLAALLSLIGRRRRRERLDGTGMTQLPPR